MSYFTGEPSATPKAGAQWSWARHSLLLCYRISGSRLV